MEDDLIKAIAKGDEKAFETLYQMTHKKVFQYVFNLTRAESVAEDILLETYTAVWKSAKKFRGESKVLTWIIGIARNLTMNTLRRKKKIREVSLDLVNNQIPTQPSHVESDLEDMERTRLVTEALDLLSDKHKEVLDLVFMQGMRYEEVSRLIAVPLNTVKTRIFYAKKELKDILTRRGVEKDDLR